MRAPVGCLWRAALFKLEAFRRGAVDQVTVRVQWDAWGCCCCSFVCVVTCVPWSTGVVEQAAMTRHRSAVAVQVQGCNVLKTITFKQGARLHQVALLCHGRVKGGVPRWGVHADLLCSFADVVKGAAVESGIVRSLVEVLSLAVEAGATGATAEAVSMAEAGKASSVVVCPPPVRISLHPSPHVSTHAPPPLLGVAFPPVPQP